MIKTVICYKTNKPVIYNEGTEWESSCDHFLLFYMNRETVQEAQAICDELNKTRPTKYCGLDIFWKKDDIKYLYASEQEEMWD